jgi:pilus assembly protein CpaF
MALAAAIERVARRLVEESVSLDVGELWGRAGRLLREEAPLASPGAVQQVVDAVVGLGPLEELLRDDRVSDVLVNGPREVWVERAGVLQRTGVVFASNEAVVAAVERVISPLGLRLDRASPAVDARLPDGSRLHAAIPPIAVDGPMVAVRRFTDAVTDLEEMVEVGAMDATAASILGDAVARRANVLVGGATGSGKTTMLNVLSRAIPEGERVVTIEDAAELRLAGHVVRLEARPANTEGAGRISVEDLVRHALRLRPDRIIVGEVRGPEAFDLVVAMSTGHNGSMSTVHSSSPEEALVRLQLLAVGGNRRTSSELISRQLSHSLDLVVQMERRNDRRRVAVVTAVVDGDLIEVWRP